MICLEDDYRIDFDNKGNIKKEESLITLQNASLDKNPVYKKGDKNYFGVPINIYFLGTMNDIDRSVDSFDMALRRRFFWKEIRCNYDFIQEKTNEEFKNIYWIWFLHKIFAGFFVYQLVVALKRKTRF